MRRILCGLFYLFAVQGPVRADEVCAAIESDAARLQCYDGVYREVPPLTEPDTGAWRIERDANALTGLTDIFVSVRANESFQCGYQRQTPTLYLRCMDNTTAALLVTGCFMADIQGFGSIRYRIDEAPMRTKSFVERTDNMALGLWTYRQARPFIEELSGAEKLVMEFTPYNDIPKQSTFDIAGLSEALEPLKEACGW